MELRLTRDVFTDTSTEGVLTDLESKYDEFFTLEDKDRHLEDGGEKIYGETAIPRGRYKVVMDWSPHFGMDMPHILDVPGFEGVRIHAGNSPKDTEGCILVGKERGKDFITNSRQAFYGLLVKIHSAVSRGEEVWLTIV